MLFAFSMVLPAAPLNAQRTLNERFAISADAYIRIHNLTGTVRVTGWDRDSVAVTGTVHEPDGQPFYMGATGDAAKLGVWSNDATDLPPSSIVLMVPHQAQLWIKTASSDVFVTDVTGGVDINSVTGSISVRGSPSEIYAETLGGRIDVDAQTRLARARTASGAINVRGAIRDVLASSVSGDLEISGNGFERGSFESVDGDIRYFGNVGRASALDFTSHSGAVEFALPPEASGDFVVSTFYGEFDDRFGVRTTAARSKLSGQEFRFTLRDGGGQVTVRNFKGRVVLRRKD